MILNDILKICVNERICVYLDNGLQPQGYEYLTLYDFEDKNKEVLHPYLEYPVIAIEPEEHCILSIFIKGTKIV